MYLLKSFNIRLVKSRVPRKVPFLCNTEVVTAEQTQTKYKYVYMNTITGIIILHVHI